MATDEIGDNRRLLNPKTKLPYTEKNPVTGLPVAAALEEMYPLAQNSIRLIHRTSRNHISSIIDNGLVYNSANAKKKISGLQINYKTAREMVHEVDEEQFWKLMERDNFSCGVTAFADVMAVFDVPKDEFFEYHVHPNKKYGLAPGATIHGVVPNRYLVGLLPIPNKNSHAPQYSSEELHQLKNEIEKKQPLQIEPDNSWRILLNKHIHQNSKIINTPQCAYNDYER